MNLKTYTAGSLAEALALVRSDLGSDAVILHTRNYKRGGILGIGAKNVVEITAGSGQAVGRYRRQANERARAKRLASMGLSSPSAQQADERARLPRHRPMQAMPASPPPPPPEPELAGDLIRRTYAAAKAELEQSQRATETAVAESAVAATAATAVQPTPAASPAVTVAPPLSVDTQQFSEELQAVKRMVAQLMRQNKNGTPQSISSNGHGLPDKLMDQYLTLLQQEVAEELADEVVQQVQGSLDPRQVDDDQACRRAMADAVTELFPTDRTAGALRPTSDGRPRVIALVGPTGVGKTTTIAKLAATFKLKQNKKVALITLDTYRIAAVDQLRTYAGIIGVPLHVALSPDELKQAIARCSDCDGILIDTAGRSQRDGDRLDQLAQFIDAAQPHDVHLVLSSTCSQSVLMEAVERFAKVRTDSIIFTKLDEAVSFGVLLNVLRKVNKRLSYITTGQEVPHQIEPGNSGRLAALVLGEGAVRS